MKLVRTLTAIGYAAALCGAAATAMAATNVVTQNGKAFSVKEMALSVGDSLTFVNDDSVKHNILIKDIGFNSGMQEPGSEAMATFDKSGKFKVRCGIHPKMKLTVTVN